ncbi:MAG: UPF0280 family protein [Desulfuromonas sp.]|mgnify:CR=1 FL=1|nr:MAG: UPF0280 family protein [Desulfuromonas sp.]
MRRFHHFRYQEAAFAVATSKLAAVRDTVKKIRRELEAYITEFPEFRDTLIPQVQLKGNPPEAAIRMHAASQLVGVGPMAAVAGTVAQLAVEAAVAAGCRDTIVNNGGDIFMHLDREAFIGIYGGGHALADRVAFHITPEDTPLALCSSSSKMGHSLSFGDCDLATVCASDGALADAAATLAANLSRDTASASAAAERIAAIPGVQGVLILVGEAVISAGEMPALVSCSQDAVRTQVVRHPESC